MKHFQILRQQLSCTSDNQEASEPQRIKAPKPRRLDMTLVQESMRTKGIERQLSHEELCS